VSLCVFTVSLRRKDSMRSPKVTGSYDLHDLSARNLGFLEKQKVLLTTETLKGKAFHWGWSIQFRGSVHYHHGGKHGSVQPGLVHKELRVLHPDQHAAGWGAHWAWLEHLNLKVHSQWHTSSNKATPTPTRPHLLIEPLPMGLWGPSIQTSTLFLLKF